MQSPKRACQADGDAQPRCHRPGLPQEPRQELAARDPRVRASAAPGAASASGAAPPNPVPARPAAHIRARAAQGSPARVGPPPGAPSGGGIAHCPTRSVTGRTPRPPRAVRTGSVTALSYHIPPNLRASPRTGRSRDGRERRDHLSLLLAPGLMVFDHQPIVAPLAHPDPRLNALGHRGVIARRVGAVGPHIEAEVGSEAPRGPIPPHTHEAKPGSASRRKQDSRLPTVLRWVT